MNRKRFRCWPTCRFPTLNSRQTIELSIVPCLNPRISIPCCWFHFCFGQCWEIRRRYQLRRWVDKASKGHPSRRGMASFWDPSNKDRGFSVKHRMLGIFVQIWCHGVTKDLGIFWGPDISCRRNCPSCCAPFSIAEQISILKTHTELLCCDPFRFAEQIAWLKRMHKLHEKRCQVRVSEDLKSVGLALEFEMQSHLMIFNVL